MSQEDWKDDVDDWLSSSKVKHPSGVPVKVTFLDSNPMKRIFTKDGKEITCFDWVVQVEESGKPRKKIESVSSKRLLALIRKAADERPLKGRTFVIIAIGDGILRTWTLDEVK